MCFPNVCADGCAGVWECVCCFFSFFRDKNFPVFLKNIIFSSEREMNNKRERTEEKDDVSKPPVPVYGDGKKVVKMVLDGLDANVVKKLKEESETNSLWKSKGFLLLEAVQELMEKMEKLECGTNEDLLKNFHFRMYEMVETLLKHVTKVVLAKHRKLTRPYDLEEALESWCAFMCEHSLKMEDAALEMRNKNMYMFPRAIKRVLSNICDFADRELKQ